MGLLSKAAVRTDSSSGMPDGAETELHAFIEEFRKINVSFHCLLIQADVQAVRTMIKSFGEAADTGGGTCLALLPLSVDRELAAHRLAQSLDAKVLCQCEANSSDAALAAISAYL